MWDVLERQPVEIIILDVMMPGEDGLSLCRRLRDRFDIPIIMLSARGELVDRIIGLEMGADDYLPKPFDPRELLTRIRAVLRRSRPAAAIDRPQGGRFRFADWCLDSRSCELSGPEGRRVRLGGTDYLVLRALLRNPHRTLTRETLIAQVYGKKRGGFDRAIDVSISRLRHQLEDDARNPALIRTVRNGGYVMSVDVVPL